MNKRHASRLEDYSDAHVDKFSLLQFAGCVKLIDEQLVAVHQDGDECSTSLQACFSTHANICVSR